MWHSMYDDVISCTTHIMHWLLQDVSVTTTRHIYDYSYYTLTATRHVSDYYKKYHLLLIYTLSRNIIYYSYYALTATRRISDCYKTYLWLLILYTNRYQTCQWLLQEISFTTHVYIVKKYHFVHIYYSYYALTATRRISDYYKTYHLLLILYIDCYKTCQLLLQEISFTTHIIHWPLQDVSSDYYKKYPWLLTYTCRGCRGW